MEQQAVYDGYWTLPQTGYTPAAIPTEPSALLGSRAMTPDADVSKTILPGYCCPSDIAPVPNELSSPLWGLLSLQLPGALAAETHMEMPFSMKSPGIRESTSGSLVSGRTRIRRTHGLQRAPPLPTSRTARQSTVLALRGTWCRARRVGLGRGVGGDVLRQYGRRPILDGPHAELRRGGRGLRLVSTRCRRRPVRHAMHHLSIE